jgi:hypothetical protein
MKNTQLLKSIEKDIATTELRMHKYQKIVDERQAKSKIDFPGKTVLEVETVNDWIDMAGLCGDLRTLKKIRKRLKS